MNLLASRVPARATRFAHAVTVDRVGDYGLRAATTRALLLVVIGATAAGAAAPWPVWASLVLGAFGSYLSATTNYFLMTGRSARQALGRLAQRNTADHLGNRVPDISGLVEFLAYVPLVAIGPWLMHGAGDTPRLICFTAGVAWLCSCLSAIFVDAAFYNPVPELWFMTAGRNVIGFAASAIVLAGFGLPAWDGDAQVVAVVISALPLLVHLRIRETDRLMRSAERNIAEQRIDARTTLINHAHDLIGAPVEVLRRAIVEDLQPTAPAIAAPLVDRWIDLAGGYRSLLAFDTAGDVDVDWPGLLRGSLRQLRAAAGLRATLDFDAELTLGADDRRIAHRVLYSFATNASNAGAETVHLTLAFDGAYLTAQALDDGHAVDPSRWKREGGALARLEPQLTGTGGQGITHLATTAGKSIQAHWKSGPGTEVTTR